jgi:hypothetical protein
MRARDLAPFLLAFAALGCGETLIDHSSPLAEPPAVGNGCNTVAACGPSCVTCTDAPAGAVAACLGPRGQEQCSYECEPGFLKCDDAAPGGACCPATKVAAGKAHTCAIAGAPAAGDVYCWGANESGQAAPGVVSSLFATPRKVPGVASVDEVALGDAHTCARTTGGAVVCWGANGAGQLGPGGAPVAANATAIAAGAAHSCAVVAGAVVCWGANGDGQLGPGGAPIAANATAIAAGAAHSCAIVSGEVRCWGAGSAGQLGNGSLAGSPAPVPATGIAGASRLAARGDHTCAAVPTTGGAIDQALQCWGDAPGPPWVSSATQSTPDAPLRPNGSQSIVRDNVALLGTGRTHVCAREAGQFSPVVCFGNENGFGQLGENVSPLEGPNGITITGGAVSLAVGADHGCAVLAPHPDQSPGALLCWGANAQGQLGNGTTVVPPVGAPVPISGR